MSEKSYMRAIELREAVKEAERVEDAWRQAPRSQTVDSPRATDEPGGDQTQPVCRDTQPNTK
jgi:hypothetical protein